MESFDFKLPHGDQNVLTAYRPASGSPCPVVINCHGWGETRSLGEVQRALAEGLVAAGAGLIQFDFYGRGDTGGDFSGMTYGRWTANLADVFEWAAAQPWVDPTRIALIGLSSGTTAMLRFAARDPRPFCAISTATCLGHFIIMGEGGPARVLLGSLDSLLQGGMVPFFDASFPMEFFRDVLTDAPVHTVKDIVCPVFFLEGGADNPYRRSDGRLGHMIRENKGLPTRHVEVEGGDHGLFNVGETRNRLILEYLKDVGLFGAKEVGSH